MTQSLEAAFAKASQLPEEEQETLAALILAEIESEQRWDGAFAKSQDRLAELADQALAEHRAGRTRRLDPDDL